MGRVEDVAEEAKWKVKGAGYNVLDTIKRNPVPAALAAIGLGWLFMESRSSRGQYDRRMYQGRYDQSRYSRGEGYEYRRGAQGYYPYEEEERSRVQAAGERVRETAAGAADKAGQVVDQARSQVQDFAGRTQEKAGQVAEQAREGAQQVAEEVQYRASRVKSQMGTMMDENPLLIGAAALALGAAIGFALPTTEKENELMGEARDSLMGKAHEAASEAVQKVQSVATEAGKAAKEAARQEAENQNLGGSQD
jgi:hypothetical protein